MKEISIVLSMDEELIDNATAMAQQEFGIAISMAALLRTLVGLYQAGEIHMRPEDAMKYSPKSFKNKRNRKSVR